MDKMTENLSVQYRRAMRGFPGGVVVVTAADTAGAYAMTMTSVMSLSMDPPSLVICVNRKASIYPALERGAGFCVNLLTDSHQEVADACSNSGRRDSRFSTGLFALNDEVPYLSDAQANLFCAQNGRYLYATHALIIGKLESALVRDVVDPLLYLDGKYYSCRAGSPERQIGPAAAA